ARPATRNPCASSTPRPSRATSPSSSTSRSETLSGGGVSIRGVAAAEPVSRERAVGLGLVLAAAVSPQVGAAFAVTLFDELGPAGARRRAGLLRQPVWLAGRGAARRRLRHLHVAAPRRKGSGDPVPTDARGPSGAGSVPLDSVRLCRGRRPDGVPGARTRQRAPARAARLPGRRSSCRRARSDRRRPVALAAPHIFGAEVTNGPERTLLVRAPDRRCRAREVVLPRA